jgi:hypothetical protein
VIREREKGRRLDRRKNETPKYRPWRQSARIPRPWRISTHGDQASYAKRRHIAGFRVSTREALQTGGAIELPKRAVANKVLTKLLSDGLVEEVAAGGACIGPAAAITIPQGLRASTTDHRLHKAGERGCVGRGRAANLVAAEEPERIGIVVRRSAILGYSTGRGRDRLRPELIEADCGGECEHATEPNAYRIYPHGRSHVCSVTHRFMHGLCW